MDFNLPNAGPAAHSNPTGQAVSLADYPEAKGFIVVFTCNHCPYAVPYEARLMALHAKFAQQGLPLIAISSNDAVRYPQDSFERMQDRAAQRGYAFPYLYDEGQSVARAYGAERTPHAFLLHKTARGLEVLYQGAIDDNYQSAKAVTEKYVQASAEAMLKGEDIPYRETAAVGCSIKWKLE